ncbi:type VI secretion system tip protein VgrG [uncultured Roseovarius sp.]|uniref:type VI secretion system tip protein VgrG n=1 Tax=uncultured Roseovarius sp. TaxID=293344 RepID=UPI00262C1588|nr:type VI secretion system tip protein VgrG [uncultured Roseovarius sp.]
MPESVWKPDADLVTVEVSVNGTRIPDTYLVSAIETEHAINRVANAVVNIADGSRVETDFAASSSSDFEPGAEIEIKAGYHVKNQTVFKGIITGQSLRVDTSGRSNLRVLCRDKAVKLTITRNAAQYYEMSDSDVIQKILSDAGLEASVSSTSATLPQQGRTHATDWDFILARAEVNGQLVMAQNGKVSVAPPKFDSPVFTAEYGSTIVDVDLSLDATDQLSDVKTEAWDPKTQAVISGNSTEPNTNAQGNLSGKKLSEVLSLGTSVLLSQGPQTSEALTSWASARLLKSRLSRIRGRITTPGNAGLAIGTQINLAGLGKKFDGDAYITGVRHQLADGDWSSELQFGLSSSWFTDINRDVSPAPAASLRPGASGLEIAVVLKTDEDPEGERRIKVSLPLRTDGNQGIWVRIVSPYATKNAGIEFLPEIGDEVVLGFLNGDPDAAIMLGSLHSSSRPAPIEPDAENTIKTIVTRAQHKVSFDDDKKIITVETPGGHSIVMSDEGKSVTVTDSNANKLEMAEGGITMTSPKDITITADGSVAIKGTSGVDVSSPADVSVKGSNVSVNADIGFTAQGNATAELSSSGETSVQGSMVMIN